VIVPVGLPPAALPVTLALSVLLLPRTIVELAGFVLMVAVPAATVKHSSVLESELEV
jgi:hypothetical protein